MTLRTEKQYVSHGELQALDTETSLEARMRLKKSRISGEKAGTEGLKAQLARAQNNLAALGEEVDKLKWAVEQASWAAKETLKIATDEAARVLSL